jgi:glutathione synthase/RimK-type ligase-like ATP-grasp enzyme
MTYRQTDKLSIALVTCEGLPDLTPGDQLLAVALTARGVAASAMTWSDPTANWDRFGAIIVRSTWDYFIRAAEFVAWLDALEHGSAPVWNPVRTLRWNHDKRYLRELAARGVRVVPTTWVPRGSDAELHEIAAAQRWHDVVIKPAISASAHQTWRSTNIASAEDGARFRSQCATGDLMLQAYLPTIERSGEWSLVFIEGQFTHAVRKLPRAGDFRVQAQHGGTVIADSPPARLVEDASRALSAAPTPTLYARVDGCEVNGGLVLMELELLEPDLFLGHSQAAVDLLADAIHRSVVVGG